MTRQPIARKPWRWIAVLAILALVAAGGWVAGARFSRPDAAQAAAGYDIGVAGKPKPTGQIREFQLVAKEVPWEIAPGVTVPAISTSRADCNANEHAGDDPLSHNEHAQEPHRGPLIRSECDRLPAFRAYDRAALFCAA